MQYTLRNVPPELDDARREQARAEGRSLNEVALDTNRYTDLCRGVEEVVDTVAAAASPFVPFVVQGELLAGFA